MLMFKHETIDAQAIPLSEEKLAQLALRFVGDDGATERGTCEAMAWQDKVNNLKQGETINIPNTAFIIERV